MESYCRRQGKTREKALDGIREAIVAYTEALEKDHLPIPPEKFETEFLSLL